MNTTFIYNHCMPTQIIKITRKELVAEGTLAVHFEKPAGFKFVAGQYMDWTLTDDLGASNTHSFSIVSAPHEPELTIATRLRDSAFKRTLQKMELGDEISAAGPFGSFTLHHATDKPAVFLAGGIGITPFFSMIKNALHQSDVNGPLSHQIYLFYSNRRMQDAPFHSDLATITNDRFHYIPVWSDAMGYINADLVRTHIEDIQKPIYYIAGPPTMVAAMYKVLTDMGVSPDNIRSEDFAGY